MQFNKEIIDILKNFSLINQSILFKEGNRISTVSPQKDIMATVEIQENIPRDFAIYDLNEFLGILSLMPNCTANFTDSQIILTNKSSKVKYTFAHESTIVSATYKDIPVPKESIITEFELSYETFNNIIKASSILKFEDIMIEGTDGKIEIRAVNKKNESSSSYVYTVENVILPFTSNFKKKFIINSFKLKESNYLITVPTMNLLKFTSIPNNKMKYWIAAV